MIFNNLTLFLSLLNINSLYSYSLNKLPFTIVNPIQKNNIETNIIKTFESIDETNNSSIIFFPGLTSDTLPIESLYTDFLNIVSEKSISVYIPNNDNMELLLDNIKNTNNNITLVSHSNSAIQSIELCNNYDFINNLILIDPINLPNNKKEVQVDFEIEDINAINKKTNKKEKIKINNIDNLLIIYTKLSNDWRILPITFPIGHFSIKTNDLLINENISKNIIKVDSFGHFDILDNSWSTIIHNTLSKGSNDRSDDKIKQYHSWIAKKIHNFIN